MKNKKAISKILLDKETLIKLPLTYHYLIEKKTEEISELNHKKKFSRSKQHFSKTYLKKVHYKPISLFFIKE